MTRVLLSIGCNEYSLTSPLTGAESDASSIFSTLVGDSEHQYDPIKSKLLLSPTSEEFRKTLPPTLYDQPKATVVTFYFAGHASVFDETLYLAFKDTNPAQIPATAIAFPDILRVIASARPKQVNFILDACNASGLGFDIATVLKRAIVGSADSIGFSFVAAATAEQSALETKEGGYFTLQFEKAIRGDTFVQNARPFLNLAEIAQQVQLDWPHQQQTISYWTLNLQGPNLFAKNPRYFGPSYVTDSIALLTARSQTERRGLSEEFKSEIAKIPNGIDEGKLSVLLNSIFSEDSSDQLPILIYGLAEGLRSELINARDWFLEPRLYTVLLGQMLRVSGPSKNLAVKEIISWLRSANKKSFTALREEMRLNKSALLIDSLSDLYELPVRISDILGQCALFSFSSDSSTLERASDLILVKSLAEDLLKHYGNSVLAISDEQATGYLLFLELCRQNEWRNLSDEIVGRLYNDFLQTSGRCGAYGLTAHERVDLLQTRYQPMTKLNLDLYNQPSDLASVILSFASLCFLDEAVDTSLIQIDHTSVNFFVPDALGDFGSTRGIDGINFTISLGRDFWRAIDLRRILQSDILPRYQRLARKTSPDDYFCSLAIALALRDRIPWHVVAPSTPKLAPHSES